jgi:hypothetical protein
MPSSAGEIIAEGIKEAELADVIQNILFSAVTTRILLDMAEGKPVYVGLAAEINRIREVNGLPPLYAYHETPKISRVSLGGTVPSELTPKIYGGGGGSNRDPPVSGGAAVQRVRETADAERKHREALYQTVSR